MSYEGSSTVRSWIAIVGATGYIGKRLVPALAGAGYDVRCFVRTNLDDERRLEEQLRGCDAAFYLVQSMQTSLGGDAAHDRAMAHRFSEAASRAGIQRIICLDWLGDER